ncbi:hypothetical protein [Pseudoalteromonas aurantia]|uniref:Uncharacterized protein n=1 Tax=Pseudoalteromonas aurantia TaxID=43654 RepID=A0ABY2VXR8_9GAMM|nr:hypothetical protein [Pseudoalteromonas aurantia]TMO59537.1 hypothetical protein CWC18_15315 [Pseudoalteromonas aurantia]TMO74551.1 hypothetical protein CWC20_09940 [Pseudoalteromonas aurantia]
MEILKSRSRTLQHDALDANNKGKLRASPRLQSALVQLNKYAISSIHQGFFLRYLNTDLKQVDYDRNIHYALAMHDVGIPTKKNSVRDLWSHCQHTHRALEWARQNTNPNHRWQPGAIRRLEWLLGVDDMLSIEHADQWPIAKRELGYDIAPKGLGEWFDYANNSHSIERVLVAYEHLCILRSHEQDDGRVASVFLEAVLNDLRPSNRYWLTPLFVQPDRDLTSLLVSYPEFEEVISKWENQFENLVDKQRYIYNALKAFDTEFDLVLQTQPMPKGWYELKMILLAKPIITMEIAHVYLEASSCMFEYGLLQVKHIKALNNMTVFECPAVFELWGRWENIVKF